MDRPGPNPDSALPASREPDATPPDAEGSNLPPTGPYSSAGPDTPLSQQQTAPDGNPLPYRPASGTVGNYELLAEVARGGMGIVYKARHATRGQIVALKMMRADDADPQHVERFDREVRAATWLKHANIVPVYEVSRHHGEPYYTMEFVPGGSVAHHRVRLLAEPRAVLTLMAQVAEAVQYAHERGVIHRDLKLGNVLLAADGTPKVTDFGLAKLGDGDMNLTKTGAALGTVPYMAPEQAAGRTKQIGPATDIWALGVMLYELLTGRRPFLGEDSDTVKRQIRKSEPPRPRALRQELSEAVEAVVLRCLEKVPGRRYASAGDLADALGCCLQGKPIPQLGRRWPGRLWQTVRRYPRTGAILCLCLAAILMAVVLYPAPRRVEAPAETEQQSEPSLTLIGPGGLLLPRDGRWLAGGEGARAVPPGPDKPFSIHTDQVSLFQLLRTPPWEHFLLEAEIRHDSSTEGVVGLFFAHAEHNATQGLYHFFWSANFADHGDFAGELNLAAHRLQSAAPHSFNTSCVPVPSDGSNKLAARRNDPSPWRKLAVEVTGEEVRATLDDKCVQSASQVEVQQRSGWMFATLTGVEPDFAPKGPLGLYVNRGTASFQHVRIRRLP
jgi:serine/threonine-protein kinase